MESKNNTVDDLNYEDEDDYESDNPLHGEDHGVSRGEELDLVRRELEKYKDRALKLREELRESETRSQDLSHEYSRLIQERENELTALRKELEDAKKEPVDMDSIVASKVKEAAGSYQKRIDALQSQIQEKDEQMKKQQDQNSRETSILKEKLIRVESNLQQTNVSPIPNKEDITSWLQQVREQLDSLPQTMTLTLSPPPSSISGEMYICLDGIYTGVTTVQQALQTSITELQKIGEQYELQQTQLTTLISRLLKEDISVNETSYTQSLERAKQLQEENEKMTSELSEMSVSLAKEKERSAMSVNTAERRYESLRNEMRECLRKEQEYEDQLTGLRNDKHKLESIIREYEETADTETLKEEMKKKVNEIESLTFQLAAFKSENDELLEERLSHKKELEEVDTLKSQLSECLKERDALKEAYETVVGQQSVLEAQLKQQEVQLKNAQDDLNFAQLCVGNLQASLAVYTAGSSGVSGGSNGASDSSNRALTGSNGPSDESNEDASGSNEISADGQTENENDNIRLEQSLFPTEANEPVPLPPPTESHEPCAECEAYQKEVTDLQARVDVMDQELRKLRMLTRDAQQVAKQESEKCTLEQRQLRQLLITYLTSTRGGAALKTLMEKLNLSQDEQRVCILKEVGKFREQDDNNSFFSWLGGLSVTEEIVHEPLLDMNSSVEDLWNRLFQYEKARMM